MRRLVAVILVVALGVVGLALWRSDDEADTPRADPSEEAAAVAVHVGSSRCAECHAEASRRWRASRHAAAMREVGAGVAARFGERPAAATAPAAFAAGGASWIRLLDGAGRPADLRLAYVLGVTPIEQFLTERESGRLQALPYAYDATRGEWFDLDGGVRVAADAWEHWTNRGSTANAECLYCHTTGFEKGYDVASDAYRTRWSEAGVGCEACHGPGSRHVADLTAAGYGAMRVDERVDAACAACHSRRVELDDDWAPGDRLTDHFSPILLDDPAFHPDGQVADENFEWASFRSSRMFDAGVRCSGCHDTHSGRLVAEGNALCLGCHEERLGRIEHTRHEAPPGNQCVSCHMPETIYMQRDARRDHAMTLPDPGMTVSRGIPNACTGCHATEGAAWAIDHVEAWYDGERLRARRRVTEALDDARAGRVDATAMLAILDGGEDVVRRASAARLLQGALDDARVVDRLVAATEDDAPLVRAGAVWAFAERSDDPRAVVDALARAAHDPTRLVRVNAAWALRDVDLASLPEGRRADVEGAFDEWLGWHRHISDSSQGSYNLGVFLRARGDVSGAVAAYRAAVRMVPQELWPRQNLAVLLGETGMYEDAVGEFREIMARHPRWAGGPFAFALLEAEHGKWPAAARLLEAAVERDRSYPRALYNLGLAYLRTGRVADGIAALQDATAAPDSRVDAIRVLTSVAQQLGDDQQTAR